MAFLEYKKFKKNYQRVVLVKYKCCDVNSFVFKTNKLQKKS